MRSLEQDGLVVVRPDPSDKRVRTVRLTAAGRAEREVLDRRSDELAWSLLASLSEGQRARLTEAMAIVERLLTAGLVEVGVEPPDERRRPALHRVLLRRARDPLRQPGSTPAGASPRTPRS